MKQIKTLLDREARQLADALRSQRRALEEKRRLLDRAIEAIHNAEKAIRPGQQADAAMLKKIIEVIEMQDNTDFMKKYYSEAGQAKMAERREQWNPELQAQATKDWTDLFRDVEAALGEDPASERCRRWRRDGRNWWKLSPAATATSAKGWARLGPIAKTGRQPCSNRALRSPINASGSS